MPRTRLQIARSTLIVLALLLGGCSSFNRTMYDFNRGLRNTARSIAPKATASAPRRCPHCGGPEHKTGFASVAEAVANVFDHISYLDVIANDLLQGNGANAWQDTQRFVINTTLGVGGTRDIATRLGFPRRREDFGQTLGVWGVPEGPYLVLPFMGPQTVRSLFSPTTRLYTNPVALINEPAVGLVGTAANIASGPTEHNPEPVSVAQDYEQARVQFLQRNRALVRNDPSVEPVRNRAPLLGPVGSPPR